MAKPVLVFIGLESCIHCTEFKPEWDVLEHDRAIQGRFYTKMFIEAPGESLPPGLKWIRNFPTIMLVPYSVYARAFNPNTDQPVNIRSPITGKVYPQNLPRSAEDIKRWAFSQ
jgi:hypothetical protein